MQDGIIRKIGASLVVSSVWFTAASLPLAAQTQAQPQDPAAANKASDKKDKKDKSAKPDPTPAPTGTLSTNDDPAMIGKRNINGSLSQKITGKLGGLREKEIAIGRQLAAEVEQQSK